MIQLTVTRTESVTPVIRRVWFHSDDLSAFTRSDWTDRYVKLQFPDAVRTYTALFPDVAAGTLALDWLPGRVHAFVHGEAAEVMHDIRPYLLKDLGLDRDQVSISGYWRRGRSEEGFRQWKAELRATEGASA